RPTLRLRQAKSTTNDGRGFVYHDGPIERLIGLPTATSPGRPRDKTLLLGAQVIAIAAIFLAAVVGGVTNGLTSGRAFHRTELEAVHVTRNIDSVPDTVVVK